MIKIWQKNGTWSAQHDDPYEGSIGGTAEIVLEQVAEWMGLRQADQAHQKHDDTCLRRRDRPGKEFLCTCDMTDDQVAEQENYLKGSK